MSRKGSENMANDDKLPRGHAYIRVRNKGQAVHLDYRELESPGAERIMKALCALLKEESEQEYCHACFGDGGAQHTCTPHRSSE